MGLRILHVTEDYSSKNTGITSTVCQLTGWLVDNCDWVGVYATGNVDVSVDENVHIFNDENFVFPQFWRKPKLVSERLFGIIQENQVQIIHLHGIWRAAPRAGQQVASRLGIPTVWSVHGQCEDWAVNGQGRLKKWKKRLYWHAFAKPVFQNVNCMHAITPIERNNLARLFPDKRTSIIPNAVIVPEKGPDQDALSLQKEILFLGRLHPVKGVDLLLKAFADSSLANNEWKLLIAGPEEVKEYAENLKDWVRQHNLTDRISFLGAVYGNKKKELLERVWVVVVPSRSEVVGMVNLEAGLCMTPTITTYATGLLDWEYGGGVLIDSSVSSLSMALKQCCAWSINERLERGGRSLKLVKTKYSLDAVGKKWLSLYSGLVGDNCG